MAVRLTRRSRVGSYVVRQTRTPTIRAYFLGGSGRVAMLNQDILARKQAPPQAKCGIVEPRLWVAGRRRGTERRRAGKERTEPAPRDSICFSDQNRTCEERLVFGTGDKGNPV